MEGFQLAHGKEKFITLISEIYGLRNTTYGLHFIVTRNGSNEPLRGPATMVSIIPQEKKKRKRDIKSVGLREVPCP